MNFFFILALGRSGTQFLASLLAKSPGALVYHEPAAEDPIYFGLRYAGDFKQVTDDYLEKRFRGLLPEDGQYEVYGEVNSYLRYEVDWLQRRFSPVLIHLVRDGRDFVRSAYTREVYTIKDKNPLVPRDSDPYAQKWSNMNRFQKLCWYWTHTNEFLFSKLKQTVRLEKLVTDYGYFKERILEPTGLQVSFAAWSREVKKPKNTSQRRVLKKKIKRIVFFWEKPQPLQSIPPWSKWDTEKKEQFHEICAETMTKLGYSLNREL
jgi:hypothetical protein